MTTDRILGCPQGDPDGTDDKAPAGLVVMLIDFDDDGNSVGRSWTVDDAEMAAHLRHLATHLGEPMTDASIREEYNARADRIIEVWVRCQCRQYVGPIPLDEVWAPPVVPTAADHAIEPRPKVDT